MSIRIVIVMAIVSAALTNTSFGQQQQDKFGPNAAEETRTALSKLLHAAAVKELAKKEFSDEGKEDIRIKKTIPIKKKIKLPLGKSITIDETIKIDEKLGEAKAKITASFDDPAKLLNVSIPDLRRKSDLEVRGKCSASCPFRGKINAKVLGVPINLSFTAKASLDATADIKFSAAGNDQVTITPTFVNWKGKVSEVKFSDDIADAVLSKLATRLVNNWLEKNKKKLKDHANKAIQQAAKEGKLTADPNELFK